jgi:molybdopterin biosynthesis enzyme
LAWQGSGDLRTLASADGLAFFPGEERTYETGESVQVRYWREPTSSGKPIA